MDSLIEALNGAQHFDVAASRGDEIDNNSGTRIAGCNRRGHAGRVLMRPRTPQISQIKWEFTDERIPPQLLAGLNNSRSVNIFAILCRIAYHS